jgi:hypothetical protein
MNAAWSQSRPRRAISHNSAVPGTDRYERLATARDDSRPAVLRYVFDGTTCRVSRGQACLRLRPLLEGNLAEHGQV